MSDHRKRSGDRKRADRYGCDEDDSDVDAYRLHQQTEGTNRNQGGRGDTPQESAVAQPGRSQEIFRDEESEGEYDDDDGFDMSLSELLYSTSSFYAIVVPGKKDFVLVSDLKFTRIC